MAFVAGAELTAAELNTFAPGAEISNVDGIEATPSYNFVADRGTGWWRPATSEIAVSTNSVERFRVANAAVTSTVPYLNASGTAAAPAYSFSGASVQDDGFFSVAASQIGVSTGGTKRIQFGNAGISVAGTGTFDSSNYRLHLEHNVSTATVMRVNHTGENTTTSKVGINIYLGADNGNSPGTNDDFMQFRKGDGTVVGSIDGTGSSGTRFNTTSDSSIKENIRPSEAAEQFDAIRWRTFEMIETGTTQHGVVAQELVEVPGLAYIVKPGNDEEYLWSINESALIGVVGGKVASLAEQLAAATARLDALESAA